MNFAKRLALCFLCVCLVAVGHTPITLAENGYDYSSVAETLLKIGFLKEINVDFEAPVTRAELATMVSPFISDAKLDGTGMFIDVEENNRHAGDINLLASAGIMNGYGDGTFRPDNPVTLNESLKVLATVLGYGPMVEVWGGYPAAYIRAAAESDLTDRVDASGNDQLTYGEAIQLIFNAATADMLKLSVISNDSVKLEKISGQTLLSEYFDIYQHEGIMTATGITSLTGTDIPPKNKIRVGGQEFTIADGVDFSSYLGFFVNCYYKKDGSGRKALFLDKEDGKNNELQIAAEDIDYVTLSGNTITIGYDNKTGKIRKENVSTNVDVIYNGKAFPDYIYTDLDLKSGYLTLVSNDGDSETDVILVTEFDTLIVKSVSVADNKVYGVYGAPLVVDEYDVDKAELISATGEKIGVSDIKKDNVLSVAKSKDGKVVLAICENRGVIGNITVIEEDAGSIVSCVVNDNIYTLTEELQTEIKKPSGEQKRNFALGNTLRFVVTHDGKIAWTFSEVGGEKYGYLLEAVYGKDAFNPEEGKFLIFSQDGELAEIKAAEKIETNIGVKNIIDTLNQTGFDYTTNGGEVTQQVVKYELNAKGELDKIYYANDSVVGNKGDYENEVFYCIKNPTPNTYRTNAKAIGQYTLSADTVFFLVEGKEGDVARVLPEQVSISTLASLSDTTYKFTAYDYHYYKAPKAILLDMRTAGNTMSFAENVFVIQSRTKVLAGDEIQEKLIGLLNGKPAEYVVAKNIDTTTYPVSTLEEGDAVLVGVNAAGELNGYKIVCDLSTDKTTNTIRFPKGGSVIGNSIINVVVGNVADYQSNAIGVRGSDAAGNPSLTGHSVVASSYFYLYDSSEPAKKRVKVVTADEMIGEASDGVGSRVVVANRYSSVRAVIIIK